MMSQTALKRINAKRTARAEQAERQAITGRWETWRMNVRNEVTTEMEGSWVWEGVRGYAGEMAAGMLFTKAEEFTQAGFRVSWSLDRAEWTARAGLQVFKGWAFQEHFNGQEA